MASATASPPLATGADPGDTLRTTWDAYLAWYDPTNRRRGEWADGEVMRFGPTTFTHENILSFTNANLRIVLSRRRRRVVVGIGCGRRTRVDSVREPVLMVTLNQQRERITDRRLEGDADIVVKAISPDSATSDRRGKLAEYGAAGTPD